jgi:ABC-type lipoprotein release transport system permease subunit
LAKSVPAFGLRLARFSTYAFIALLLAITYIYAVVSYLVSMRTLDIGVHIALGATGAQILRMMTRQTGKLIVLGIAAGLLLSVMLTRFNESFAVRYGAGGCTTLG